MADQNTYHSLNEKVLELFLLHHHRHLAMTWVNNCFESLTINFTLN